VRADSTLPASSTAGAPALPVSAQDDAHFERILAQYSPALRRLCALYETNPAEREDIMQDVSFAIWRALPTFREECSEKTFVYRVAHNRVLSYRFRKRLDWAPLEVAEDIADSKANAEALAERNSERERLLVAVRQLPPSLRQPVVLRLEGLTDREIGDVLGISDGNVAVRLTRSRHLLKTLLRAHDRSPTK
jgi:RNA polymerase sigma factor (sigma-70 family)